MALDYFLLQQKTFAAEKQIKKYKCLTLIKVKLISGREKFHKPRFPKNFRFFSVIDSTFRNFGQRFCCNRQLWPGQVQVQASQWHKAVLLFKISTPDADFCYKFCLSLLFCITLFLCRHFGQQASPDSKKFCRDVFCLQGCVLSARQLRTPYHRSLSKIPLCLATVALAAPLSGW